MSPHPPRPSPEALAADVGAQLRALGTPERARKEKAYLRSDLEHVGATVPATRKVAVGLQRAHPDLRHEDLVALVDALWRRGVHECRFAAVELLDCYADLLTPADLALLERLLRESRTWALVDGLAASVVGGLLERFPEVAAALDDWARDDDFWLRRAALLAWLPGLRRSPDGFEAFARLADGMLDEREFFIRKAIGWVLRETGRRNPDLVARWLGPRTHRASGVTVREAVKYLPDDDRRALLVAYRAGEPAG